MTGAGPIVVLNGAPRTGKTSIARALEHGGDGRRWVNVGVDTSRATTPPALRPGIGLRPGGERPDIEDALPRLLGLLADQVAARADRGQAVVVDLGLHAGHSRPLGLWAVLAQRLGDRTVWVVGVHCLLDEVVRRRQASGSAYEALGPDGRPTAAVRAWQDAVHRPGTYDLEVDTGRTTPEDAAAHVLTLLGEPPAALARLAASGI